MKRLFVLVIALLLVPVVCAETVVIDAGANRHAIDARIYGVNNASQAQLSDTNVPVNRSGGTPVSRYNWKQNAVNVGNDYFFESVPSGGTFGDNFVQYTKAAGAEPMVTVPLLDWIAQLGAGSSTLGSFSVAKYGPQNSSDGDFGSGVKKDGSFIKGNNPNDANVASSTAFQDGWVKHLVQQFGASNANGVRYYLLDQEPGIWHSSHRDVHPVGATMQEVGDKMLAYATMIKANDPNAIVCGPDEWNFEGYLTSGYDGQYADEHGFNFNLHPDRDAHGGMDYLPYILDQFQKNERAGNPRLLDIFAVHYYPQDRFNSGAGIFSDDVTPAVQMARNVSTRSLWDPNYLDNSYLGDNGYKINLIPRLKGWVNQYYPNTRIALNEYSWGAEGHINGATAQADVLGILGREGIDMACRWEAPATGSPVANVYKLYRNYDGGKSTFGDTSVSATVTNPDNLAAFAAVRGLDGALTVIVINKVATGSQLSMALNNFNASNAAQVWELTAANTIKRLADMSVAGGNLTANLPGQSITLFVIPSAVPMPGLHIQSAAQAMPNPAQTVTSVNFSVVATDSNGDALTYQWSFGDGSQATGANVQHSYAAAGAYAAKVMVSDLHGTTVTSNVNVVVNDPGMSGGGNGIDTDGDGVPDAVEIAAGTDPANAMSTPQQNTLTLYGLKATVFGAGHNQDALSMNGMLTNLPAGFAPAGTTLTVFLNNLQLTFPLSAKGQAKTANGSLMLALKLKRDQQTGQMSFIGGDVQFSAKLKLLDLTTALGLVSRNASSTVTFPAIITLPNKMFSTTVTSTYFPGGSKPGKLFK